MDQYPISSGGFRARGAWRGFLAVGVFIAATAFLSVPSAAQEAVATVQPTETSETAPALQQTMTPNDATSGTLLFHAVEENRYVAAPLQASDVKIEVSGLTARTKLTQQFYNPTDGWVEGVYVFPLPEDAGVDILKMQIGDRFIEGQIKERQEAKRIYEAAKAEGKKASLLEQERPNLFTNSVANIGPHEVVTVQIEYQQGLALEKGEARLRFPMVVAPRFLPPAEVQMVSFEDGQAGFAVSTSVPDADRITPPVRDPRDQPEDEILNPVTLSVHLNAGFDLESIKVPFHDVTKKKNRDGSYDLAFKEGAVPANRDFELIWTAKPSAAPTAALFKETVDGEDYLYAMVTPPTKMDEVEAKPREVIFVLDNSGSMSGPSIRQAKASLLLALDRLATTDRFNVIRFDDTMDLVFPRPVVADSENINYAKRFVAKLDAAGGTMMLPALKAALSDGTPSDTSYLRQVIFLTDGAIGNEDELFAEIGANLGRSRLFTVGIGSAPNSHFMNRAARLGRGSFTYIGDLSQVSSRMDELFVKLERPLATDLRITLPEGADVEIWPNPLPDLYAGEPLIISAKLGKAKGKMVIDGVVNGEHWAQGLRLQDAAEGDGLAKIWARRKIASLEESRFDGASWEEVDKSVLQTALDYSLVSRLTSLVAVDVTPSRPADEALTTAKVPLNLPKGWDFDKVFGPKGEMRATIRADISAAPDQWASIQMAPAAPPPPSAQNAKGMALPQGATLKDLERLLGLMLVMAGGLFFLAVRRRTQSELKPLRAKHR